MAGPVGSFYLDLGVNTPQGSLKKVDAFFASIERRMAKAAKGLNIKPVLSVEFNVSKAAITRLRSAINSVSKSTTLKIGTELTAPTKKQVSAINKGLLASAKSNPIRLPVTIDARWVDAKLAGLTRRKSLLSTSGRLSDTVNNALAKMPVVPIMARVNALVLQQSVTTALRGLGSRGFTISPQVSSAAISAMRDQLRIGLSNIFINPVLSQNYLNQVKQVQKAQQATQRSSQQERPQLADKSGRNFMYGGGTAGALARYGMGSVPFIGGAYGLMQLNTANQEAISTRLTTQAVLQSQGYTEQQGEQAFDWLRNLANLNGFSYMQAAPDYNQFLSNALGAGVSLGGSQDIFRGFSEYQTAMGVTPARRKLVNNALMIVTGKHQHRGH